jgi:hypothetical protein
MHTERDQAWLDASPSDPFRDNTPLTAKAYVDDGAGALEGPLPAWVTDMLDGDAPIDLPAESGTVLARFVRDATAGVEDATERRRVLRAGLMAATGRLSDGER